LLIEKTKIMRHIQLTGIKMMLLLFIFPTVLFAQETLTGKTINDDTGEPVPFINVIQKGTNNGTTSDLDGNFSLAGVPDTAFFEERLRLLKLFKPYSFKGIPDIRVIIYNKVPIMAMLRLPTRESGGKANLQQGAVGVGIDLATGVTTTAVQGKKSRIIDTIPDSSSSSRIIQTCSTEIRTGESFDKRVYADTYSPIIGDYLGFQLAYNR
jgi:hypothetical protein